MGITNGAPPTQEGTLTVTVGTPQYRYFTFNAGSCPNSAEFSALFDYYRITKVKMTFSLRSSSSSTSTTIQPSPIVYYAIDYNDTAPASIDVLREKRQCKVVYMNDKNHRGFDVTVRPMYLETLGTGLQQPMNSGWFTCSTAGMNAPFGGLAFATEILGDVGQNAVIKYEVRYYLEFKGIQ